MSLEAYEVIKAKFLKSNLEVSNWRTAVVRTTAVGETFEERVHAAVLTEVKKLTGGDHG